MFGHRVLPRSLAFLGGVAQGTKYRLYWDFAGGPVAKTPNAGDLGEIPGLGTRSCMPQLKIPHAATNTQRSQINK